LSLIAASTNYAAVIRPLQVLVMVIAVLFFARVLRVASVQARPADYEPRSRRRRGVTIGRSDACDLHLEDTYLSSRHARIANDDGDLSIEDLGSTNGTYVNQELVKGRVHLERGDVVQVGGVLFEVVR